FAQRPPPTEIYTLSLHAALPISWRRRGGGEPGPGLAAVLADRFRCHRLTLPKIARLLAGHGGLAVWWTVFGDPQRPTPFRSALEDRKSTRLNSSHVKISYAVFCL